LDEHPQECPTHVREELVAQIHGAGGLGMSRRMEFLVAALLYVAL
jgi:hypothetical protein